MQSISLKACIEWPQFKSGTSIWQVSLELLLVGHEDWVYSVKWKSPLKVSIDDDRDHWVQPQSILSASMDKTMRIWRPESKTGIWVNEVTVGELSHSALGFYGGLWGPKGDSILAHGYGGSFHLWKNIGMTSEQWERLIIVGCTLEDYTPGNTIEADCHIEDCVPEANARDLVVCGALWELVRISRECSREDIRNLCKQTLSTSSVFQMELKRMHLPEDDNIL